MKIIIADDERMVRVSLISMLKEIDTSYEIVGEATNGEELINLLKKHKPDIAFVDIRMPKIDGLTAIKTGKEISPNTNWIILTGFSQFEYAKEAVKLGAVNYLLKPPNPKELKDTLKKLTEENIKQKHILNKKFERDIITAYHNYSYLHKIELDNFLSNHTTTGILFIIDSSLSEKEKAQKSRNFYVKLVSITDSIINNDINISIFNLINGDLITVCTYSNSYKSEGIQTLAYYFNKIQKITKTLNTSQFNISNIKLDNAINIELFFDKISF